MPNCCRVFLTGGVPKLKECKSVTRPDFYFICQVADRSLVYQISTIGAKLTCHDKLLEPLLSLYTSRPGECAIDDPPSWHFVHQESKLYVIPSIPEQNHYEVDSNSKLYKVIEQERPVGLCFSVVSRVGQHIVALSDTLQDVYTLDEANFKWLHMETSSCSVDLIRGINISGFVDLIDDMFLVSDADMLECFLLDLRKREWFAVKPPLGFWRKGLLCGRCLLADGFIYTCTGNGLAAFELLKEDTSYCLGYPALMEFPYTKFPDRKLVSFDCICKEDNPSSLVLCVVQGCVMNYPFTSHHRLATTTVEVKLKEAVDGRKVPVRIDHIDVSDSTIDDEGWIWTNFAFSL
ncbi:unnamed protein product [Urochloa humidicola]